MEKIYRLRMLSDENDNFLREYEVPGNVSLLGLHEFISQDLGYDSDGVVSFFASDGEWNKLLEFTLVDMGDGPAPMHSVTLEQVLELHRTRLIYVFDMFNDRALYLESGGDVESVADTAYPRVSLSEAAAPGQYEPGGSPEGGSIFDEALGEFGEFDGSDYYEDEF